MVKSILLELPQRALRVLSVADDEGIPEVEEYIERKLGIPRTCYWLDFRSPACISLRLRLLGGKGGFGSNLRAQGSKMSSKRRRLGNESCRNLSGQRLRALNQSRMIAEYLERKPEMDRKREAEIRDKMLKAVEAPDRKPIFADVEYLRTARETVDAVESAVFEALLGERELSTDDDGYSCEEDEQGSMAGEADSEDVSGAEHGDSKSASSSSPSFDECDKGKEKTTDVRRANDTKRDSTYWDATSESREGPSASC